MYCEYFSFREKPFNVTPDPRFLYLSPSHEEVLESLLFGINDRKGFMVLTGEVGTGKTTIARMLLNQLGETVDSALLFNPLLNTWELLSAINQDFGLRAISPSVKDQVDILNRFLLRKSRQGRNAVVIIDEAQNLSVEALEMVRLLSNLETESDKLLQILLIGQPELDEKLKRRDLRQLAQRISIKCRLRPLRREEIANYVSFRLHCAGAGADQVSFEPASYDRIFRFSLGCPRLINTLCDRVLMSAYLEETKRINPKLVRLAEKDLDNASPARGWLWSLACR